MKNWISVLLIFAVPLGVFAWLESNSSKSMAKETKVMSTKTVPTNGRGKMLKFSSPMCSDCKKVQTELVGVIPDYKDAVTFEEINVTDGTKASAAMVKDYKVTVVPTLIFVSKDGQIIHREEGFLTESEIRTHLDHIK